MATLHHFILKRARHGLAPHKPYLPRRVSAPVHDANMNSMHEHPSGKRNLRVAGHRSTCMLKSARQTPASSDFWTLSQNILAFSGMAIVIAVSVKVIRVSHQDLTTALTIATQSSPSTILLGSVLLFFPALAPALLALALVATRRSMRSARESKETSKVPLLFLGYLLVAFMILVCIITVPAILLLIAAALIAANALMRMLEKVIWKHMSARIRRKRVNKRYGQVIREALIIGLLVGGVAPVVFIAANDVVWLPSLEIEAQGHGSAFVGYEISTTSSRIIILRESDRQIMLLDPADLMSERPCKLSNLVNNQRSLYSVVVRSPAPHTPECPSQQ